jgi:tRNA-Thr(GGU) m(6)t(6)A37 methyltransferase TsaA
VAAELSINPIILPVGTVHSRYRTKDETPVQAALNLEERAVVSVHDEFADGLEGLVGFDHLWLLTWLDHEPLEHPPPLRQVPFLLQAQPREVGIFAMRGPRRPNPIGLSLVRLLEVEGSSLHIAGVDMVDGTPVLDIKPYVSQFDSPVDPGRHGWFDEIDLPLSATPESLRRRDR